MTFLLPLLFALPAAQVPANRADPLEIEYKRLEAEGWQPSEKASARTESGRLVAVIYKKAKNAGASERLYFYWVSRGKLKTIHFYPGSGVDLSLAEPHRGGQIKDLAKDGSRIIAYRIVFPGAGQEKLRVFRAENGRLAHLADFDQGRFQDVDGDGVEEIVVQERPLGKYFVISCEAFFTPADKAFRTKVFGWKDRRLVDVSKSQLEWYLARIEESRRHARAIDARATNDFGGFLSLTLTVYFDYAQIGRGRDGWKEFRSLFPVKAGDPGPVKECLKQMEKELRVRLAIPPDW